MALVNGERLKRIEDYYKRFWNIEPMAESVPDLVKTVRALRDALGRAIANYYDCVREDQEYIEKVWKETA